MSRTFEVHRSDVTVDPQVRPEYVVSEGSLPFVNGTGPILQTYARSWKFHAGVLAGIVAIAIFMNRAVFAWEWDWTDNFAVFFITILLPFVGFMWAIWVWTAFRERNSPTHPSHLLVGQVTKRGRANSNTGMRNFTVEYPSPEGGTGKVVIPQTGGRLNVGQPVLVLHFDAKKAMVL